MYLYPKIYITIKLSKSLKLIYPNLINLSTLIIFEFRALKYLQKYYKSIKYSKTKHSYSTGKFMKIHNGIIKRYLDTVI